MAAVNKNYHDLYLPWKKYLMDGMEEDAFRWDWTSFGAVEKDQLVRAHVIAKADGIWAAGGMLDAVRLLAQEFGKRIEINCSFKDGQKISKGDVLLKWKGPARLILVMERPFLNVASYVCGIATQTRKLVDIVEKMKIRPSPRVTSTRKTIPGYRDLALYGVIAGGGKPHRIGLSSGILIKENHIAAAGGMRKVIEGVRRCAPHGLKIETEVRNFAELEKALNIGVDAVLLDNFKSQDIKEAIKLINKCQNKSKIIVEVSGGINEQNISQYVVKGVDVISTGSLTHSVKALDLSMIILEKK